MYTVTQGFCLMLALYYNTKENATPPPPHPRHTHTQVILPSYSPVMVTYANIVIICHNLRDHCYTDNDPFVTWTLYTDNDPLLPVAD